MKLSLPQKMDICSSSAGAQKKGKRVSKQDETQFTTKNGSFPSFTHPLKANVLFCRFSFESHQV
jgi:hypothetical protein